MQSEKVIASAVISELQSSDMYLSIRARLCDIKKNLNEARVTEAFIDEIVNNKGKYTCIPLCADVRGLINDRTIGHMYNRATGEFMSDIIGGLYDFEKEGSGDSSALIISIRVMKRYKAVCSAIAKLYAEGRLKFSFEISCGEYSMIDGVMVIDASPLNFLEGVAVVTFPACEDAVALELVAECLSKGDENMNAETEVVEVAESVEENPVVAEEQPAQAEAVAETAETETAEAENAEAEANAEQAEAVAEEATAEEETASVITHVNVEHTETVCTYDTDTDTETCSSVTQTDSVRYVAEDDSEEETHDEEPEEEQHDECNSEEEVNAEHVPEATIAELLSSINAMKSELASLKESISHREVAEAAEAEPEVKEEEKEVTAERKWTLVNPFVSNMSMPGKKFTLLEKADRR